MLSHLGEAVNILGQLTDPGIMIREDFLHGSLLGCLQGIQLDALAGDVVQGLAEFGPILMTCWSVALVVVRVLLISIGVWG